MQRRSNEKGHGFEAAAKEPTTERLRGQGDKLTLFSTYGKKTTPGEIIHQGTHP